MLGRLIYFAQVAEEERLEEAIAAARQRKADRLEAIRQEKMDKQTRQEELDMSRREPQRLKRSKSNRSLYVEYIYRSYMISYE